MKSLFNISAQGSECVMDVLAFTEKEVLENQDVKDHFGESIEKDEIIIEKYDDDDEITIIFGGLDDEICLKAKEWAAVYWGTNTSVISQYPV